MKNLKLKPSMRLNRRYLLIESDSKETVEKTILSYIGILGYAEASPIFIDSRLKNFKDSNKKKFILAINRESITKVRASFEMSKGIKVLKVSGTLKGLEG